MCSPLTFTGAAEPLSCLSHPPSFTHQSLPSVSLAHAHVQMRARAGQHALPPPSLSPPLPSLIHLHISKALPPDLPPPHLSFLVQATELLPMMVKKPSSGRTMMTNDRLCSVLTTACMYELPQKWHEHGKKGDCITEVASTCCLDKSAFPNGISASTVEAWIKKAVAQRKKAIAQAGGVSGITGAGVEDTDTFWEFYTSVAQSIISFDERVDTEIDDYLMMEREWLQNKKSTADQKAAEESKAQELMDEAIKMAAPKSKKGKTASKKSATTKPGSKRKMTEEEEDQECVDHGPPLEGDEEEMEEEEEELEDSDGGETDTGFTPKGGRSTSTSSTSAPGPSSSTSSSTSRGSSASSNSRGKRSKGGKVPLRMAQDNLEEASNHVFRAMTKAASAKETEAKAREKAEEANKITAEVRPPKTPRGAFIEVGGVPSPPHTAWIEPYVEAMSLLHFPARLRGGPLRLGHRVEREYARNPHPWGSRAALHLEVKNNRWAPSSL